MIRPNRRFVLSLLVLCACGLSAARAESEPPVIRALTDEVARAMEQLGQQQPPPYFIGVELTDRHDVRIVGENGGLHGYAPTRRWWMDVDLRIGGRELDSSHALRSGNERPTRSGSLVAQSAEPQVLSRALWLEIDRRYQAARERWAKVEAESKVLVEEDPAEDLVQVEPARHLGETRQLSYDPRRWEETVRTASRLLSTDPAVIEGSVAFNGSAETRWFVSSEGARIQDARSHYRVEIRANTVAEDGDSIRLFHAFDAHDADGLPRTDEVLRETRELVARLRALRAAPLQEPYSGPAILSDRAAGVFFHEIFGHRIEGHRLKQVDNAQTFRNRVGESILPDFLSVVDDPSVERVLGQDLNGHYRYDNQGVPGQRVVLVEDGVLRGFLQSRSPVAKGDRSNGHGRRQAGRSAVSRQGNLIVEASSSVDDATLREGLMERVRDAGLEYGLLIDEIQGGFTFTSRDIPNAFSINAVVAWRVYADGRPDELVRGVDLIGTPLEAFSKVVGAGESHAVFNGVCGAESGWVPVSASSPALLIASIETQRKRKDQVTPPLLDPPLLPSGEEEGR